MRHIWKDFLYFSTREKIACISLIFILVTFTFIYILCSGLMKVSEDQLTEQETIRREFAEYESALEPKDLINDDFSSDLTIDSATIIEQPKTKLTTKANKEKLTSSQTIDINITSENTLTRVPGIGKATAKKIVEYRNLLGGYTDLKQLQEIQGISNNKFIKILPYFTIQKKHKVLFFYKSNIQSLINHPYLNESQLKLLKQLKEDKTISNIDDLSKYYQFKQSDIERLRPYLDFTQ